MSLFYVQHLVISQLPTQFFPQLVEQHLHICFACLNRIKQIIVYPSLKPTPEPKPTPYQSPLIQTCHTNFFKKAHFIVPKFNIKLGGCFNSKHSSGTVSSFSYKTAAWANFKTSPDSILHRGEAELRITCDTTQAQRCKLSNRKWNRNNKIKNTTTSIKKPFSFYQAAPKPTTSR